MGEECGEIGIILQPRPQGPPRKKLIAEDPGDEVDNIVQKSYVYTKALQSKKLVLAPRG